MIYQNWDKKFWSFNKPMKYPWFDLQQCWDRTLIVSQCCDRFVGNVTNLVDRGVDSASTDGDYNSDNMDGYTI